MIFMRFRSEAFALALILPAAFVAVPASQAQEAPKPTAEMQSVLDKLTLEPKGPASLGPFFVPD